ncbi:MAG: hypothetical protein RL095_3111 [Verrucomicrobiota bacterium]|jgi:hypothetical protein
MKHLLVLLLLCCASQASESPEKPAPPPAAAASLDAERVKRIDALCAIVATGNPKERRQARKDLNACDKSAAAELQAALAKANDPEVREALTEALAKFDMSGYKALSPPQITRAKNGLKMIGVTINSYFSDGTSTDFPEASKLMIEMAMTDIPNNGRPMGDSAAFSKGESDVVPLWKAGSHFAALNNSDAPLAFLRPEFTPGTILMLFGDGHVESRTFEGKTTAAALKEFAP